MNEPSQKWSLWKDLSFTKFRPDKVKSEDFFFFFFRAVKLKSWCNLKVPVVADSMHELRTAVDVLLYLVWVSYFSAFVFSWCHAFLRSVKKKNAVWLSVSLWVYWPEEGRKDSY
jgi:hypothetical protein